MSYSSAFDRLSAIVTSRGASQVRPAAGSHFEAAAFMAGSKVGAGNQIQKTESNEPRSNVLALNHHHDAISVALSSIARIVGRTLGPHGSNTLIRDEGGTHLASKDGYTVLQRLTFVQETATMVLDHVRSVSRAMVRNVGDGSTSAVIMADSLYHSLQDGALQQFPPGAVQMAISATAEAIAAGVRKVSRDATDDDILAVATIAANNNPVHGALIASAYKQYSRDTNVFVTMGIGEKTEIRAEPGYRVLRGMAHDCFANQIGLDGSTATSCHLQNSVVMVIGEVVTQRLFNEIVAPVMNACIQGGQAFTLVSRDYDSDVLRIVADFVKKSPGVQLLMLDHATATRRGSARLGDLASVLNATVIGGQNGPRPSALNDLQAACGFAAGVRSTGSETTFVLNETAVNAIKRAEELELQINRVDESNNAETLADELEELRSRRRALLGSEVTILVGGSTQVERQALMYLLDDAALAVKSALKSGVVEGLGLTALRVINQTNDVFNAVEAAIRVQSRLSEDDVKQLAVTVINAFNEAYRAAASRVLTNALVDSPENCINACLQHNLAYNVVTNCFTPLDKTMVLNPADTDIEIVKGATSIVSLFVASNQTILSRPVLGNGQD